MVRIWSHLLQLLGVLIIPTDDKEKSKQYLISSDDKGNLTNTTLECTDGNAIVNIKNIKTMKDDRKEFIQNPDGTLRINAHGIMFGGLNDGSKETNSGQISTLHEVEKLSIVGIENKNGPNRKVKLWDDVEVNGDMNVQNNMNVQKSICIGSTCITEDHLKILKGAKHIFLKNNKGQYLSRHTGHDDSWLQLRNKENDISKSWEAWSIETS